MAGPNPWSRHSFKSCQCDELDASLSGHSTPQAQTRLFAGWLRDGPWQAVIGRCRPVGSMIKKSVDDERYPLVPRAVPDPTRALELG